MVAGPDGLPLGVVTGHDLLALYGDLLAHEVHRLLVVDTDAPNGLPLGVLSTADVVAEMAVLGSTWPD